MQPIAKEITPHLPQAGEARRLFHGRGHCFAGYEDVVIDAYPPLIMVILYRRREEEWLRQLTELLLALPQPPQAILLQERFLPNAPSRLLHGELPEPLDAIEDGLRYRLRLGEAQNVGFFPDMAVGRKLVREMAQGKRMLNLFAYSCSFSVAALHGGAKQVVNLDMNRGALELGRLNHQLNDLDLRKASFMPLEFFRSVSKLRKLGPFDLIICDPPASQGKSFTAKQHWPKLTRSLAKLLAPGGEVLACLNAPDLGGAYLEALFAQELPQAQLLESYLPGADFPEANPDNGLLLQHYRLDG
ncbi:MAG: class I SAM-dependent methyltransferase [Desulfuromonadales bacterium]|nr:class I SAM-dependent methyltransferase [Desulfuromonadales bacterium]